MQVSPTPGRESSALLYAPDCSKWWVEADRYRWQRESGGSRSIPLLAVDDPVIDQVLADIGSADFAQQLVDGTRRSLSEKMNPREVRRLRANAEGLAVKIARTMELATPQESPESALRMVDELERERLVAVTALDAAVVAAVEAITSITPARLLQTQKSKPAASCGL